MHDPESPKVNKEDLSTSVSTSIEAAKSIIFAINIWNSRTPTIGRSFAVAGLDRLQVNQGTHWVSLSKL